MKRIMLAATTILCVFLSACGVKTEAQSDDPGSLVEESSQSCSSEESAPMSALSVPSQPDEPSVSSEPEKYPVVIPNHETAPKCKAYALYCVEDDKLLGGVELDTQIAPASLTKVMTSAVALRYVSPDEVFTVGSEQGLVREGSSVSFIAPGHRIKLYDLITAMMLPSGNDAAYTVAVSTARVVSENPDMSDESAVEYFCGLMNDMARELGMTGSHFADPDGWDNDAHYTTVNDLIKLSKYALSLPEIREIAAMPTAEVIFESGEYVEWLNSNKLLHPESEYYRENAIGLKTGNTDNAGKCIIAAYIENKKTYIAIVVGSESDEDRYDCLMELIG